jgi:hypothetical protein
LWRFCGSPWRRTNGNVDGVDEPSGLPFWMDRLCDVALIIEERDVAEQVLRVTGVIVSIAELHAIDRRQGCLLCRPTGRRMLLRRRQPCTVREVFEAYRPTATPGDGGRP